MASRLTVRVAAVSCALGAAGIFASPAIASAADTPDFGSVLGAINTDALGGSVESTLGQQGGGSLGSLAPMFDTDSLTGGVTSLQNSGPGSIGDMAKVLNPAGIGALSGSIQGSLTGDTADTGSMGSPDAGLISHFFANLGKIATN